MLKEGRGIQNGRGGGAREVLPLQRGGGSFEVFLTWEFEVLAILKGGGEPRFHPLKGGVKKG